MIESFTVKDFKSLVDVTVDLGVVNVFIGANGSGKSNFLEAIGILGAAAAGRVNDEALKYRGVRPGRPTLYKAAFKNKHTASSISFGTRGYGASYSVSLLNPIDKPEPNWAFKTELLKIGSKNVFGRGPNSTLRLNKDAGYAALKVVELDAKSPVTFLLETIQNYAIYAPDTPTLRGLEPDLQSREPIGLAGGRLPEAVLELVKSPNRYKLYEVIDFVNWLRHISVTFSSQLPISPSVSQPSKGLKFSDVFMQEGRSMLSGYDASEGVLYLLFLTVLALHSNTPKLFAIDNFDQALNPRTVRDFTTKFCEWLLSQNDRQVLLTTHNPLALDGLPLYDDRVRLFAVDRSKRGHTIINRVQIGEDMLQSAEKGIPLSQQWVMGHFGGVPNSV